jgi:hypothetical protein
MTHAEGESTPQQNHPLSNEEIRTKRINRDKQRLTMELNGLVYERSQLIHEFYKAQKIYAKKLDSFVSSAQKIVDRERYLKSKVEALLQLTGQCAASRYVSDGHPDPTHTVHVCLAEMDHQGKHFCACGQEFKDA